MGITLVRQKYVTETFGYDNIIRNLELMTVGSGIHSKFPTFCPPNVFPHFMNKLYELFLMNVKQAAICENLLISLIVHQWFNSLEL